MIIQEGGMKNLLSGLALALAAASPVAAEVKSSETNGFVVEQVRTIAAPPAKVWAALLNPGAWWDPDHSWSGNSANMSLQPVIGGCFCEKLPGSKGEADHLRIAYIIPGTLIRLRGALGPFQAMGVDGALSWELKEVDGATEFSQTYAVGGYIPGGGQGFAPIVDKVMTSQIDRLKALAEKK